MKENNELTRDDIAIDHDMEVDCDEGREIAVYLEALHRALQTLNDDELRMIHALYFSKKRCSERQLAKKMGISQVAVHKRKNTILEKLKKFF